MSRVTWDHAWVVGVSCAFFALTYAAKGALPASVQATVMTVSLLVVLRIGGRGRWTTAFRSLVERPWQYAVTWVLLALFLLRRLDTFDWSVILEFVLAASFLWAVNCAAILLQNRVLRRPHDGKQRPDRSHP